MKNWKLINLQLNDKELRTCGKVCAQMVRHFSTSVVLSIAELNGIGFNAMKKMFSVVWRYFLVKKKSKQKKNKESKDYKCLLLV